MYFWRIFKVQTCDCWWIKVYLRHDRADIFVYSFFSSNHCIYNSKLDIFDTSNLYLCILLWWNKLFWTVTKFLLKMISYSLNINDSMFKRLDVHFKLIILTEQTHSIVQGAIAHVSVCVCWSHASINVELIWLKISLIFILN